MENKKTGLGYGIAAAILAAGCPLFIFVLGIFIIGNALLGIGLGIPGIVLASKSLKAGKSGKAIAGLVLSIIGLLGGVLYFVILFIA